MRNFLLGFFSFGIVCGIISIYFTIREAVGEYKELRATKWRKYPDDI